MKYEYKRPLLPLVIAAVAVGMGGCQKLSDDSDRIYGRISATPGNAENVRKVIRITGIPDENPSELARKYRPMVDYLAEELGVRVTYTPVSDYGAAVNALIAGKVDFAWLGGFTHVQSRNLAGTTPVVMRAIDKKFRSAFIARAELAVKTLADLKGKSFAFGSKSSTSGRVMPQHFLNTLFNIDPKRDFSAVVFSGSHPATVKIVEGGRVDAGVLNLAIWENMVKEGAVDTSKVALIWRSPEYVDYVWTAREGVDEEIRAKFTNAFLKLDYANPAHREVLRLQRAQKFVVAEASEFDDLENTARSIGLLK